MSTPTAVHPLQPRFSQAVTGLIGVEAIVFDAPPAVAVAVALMALNLFVPRLSPLRWAFRLIAPPPARLELSGPVRFSQGLGVVILSSALVLFALGVPVAAWALVALVSGLALLAAITGICLGCEAYRVAFLLARHRRGEDVRERLGLDGPGPWLVALVAPGCARCGPATEQFRRIADPRPVTSVDLSRRPAAAALGVRSVPAAIAVGEDGRVLERRAGRLQPGDLEAVASALGPPASPKSSL